MTFDAKEHEALIRRVVVERSTKEAAITDLLHLGLTAEELRVKQYALWQIAKWLRLTDYLSDVEDHGKLL